jgi:hypothetical protein
MSSALIGEERRLTRRSIMHVGVLLLVGLTVSADPPELEKDVSEIQTLKFAIPIRIDPDRKGEMAALRLYMSEDRGKTWTHVADYEPKDQDAVFSAPHDGLYWFTVQVVRKDGKKDPPDLDKSTPAGKVYVNSERRVLKVQKSCEEVQREVEELRKTVEELKRKLAEREAGGKGK